MSQETVGTVSADEAPGCPHYPFGTAQRYELDAEFTELREQEGLSQVEMPYGGRAWLAVRDPDVRAVLTDSSFSRELANQRTMPRLTDEVLPVGSLSALDGAEHTRLRRLLVSTFTERSVRKHREAAQRVANELLDTMVAAGGPADIVSAYTVAMPTIMICDLLGVPAQDRFEFRQLLVDMRAWQRPAATVGVSRSALEDYLWSLIEAKRRAPASGLLDELIIAQRGGAEVNDQELLNIAVALLAGGVGTPAALFSGAVYLLMTQPHLWESLKADPGVASPLLEEILRYVPVGTSGGKMRVATKDVVIGGTTVRRGDAIIPVMPSADRDPARYDDPEEILIDRGVNTHLAFGIGGHRCLGAQFARMQGLAVLTALAERTPELHLVDGEAGVTWLDGDVTRGPRSIMVDW